MGPGRSTVGAFFFCHVFRNDHVFRSFDTGRQVHAGDHLDILGFHEADCEV